MNWSKLCPVFVDTGLMDGTVSLATLLWDKTLFWNVGGERCRKERSVAQSRFDLQQTLDSNHGHIVCVPYTPPSHKRMHVQSPLWPRDSEVYTFISYSILCLSFRLAGGWSQSHLTLGRRWDPCCIDQLSITRRKTTAHTHVRTYGEIRITNWPGLHVFEMWEETHRGHVDGIQLTGGFKPLAASPENMLNIKVVLLLRLQ